MAFFIGNTLCSIPTCRNATIIANCPGCFESFCAVHFAEHRRMLSNRMDEIVNEHDRLRQEIIDYRNATDRHSLMMEINNWEQESIQRIQRMANDARQDVTNLFNTKTTENTDALNHIGQQLMEARANEKFHEKNLREWKKELEKLNKTLHISNTISAIKDVTDLGQSIYPIAIINIPNDRFVNPMGNIEISGNGQLVEQGLLSPAGSIRTDGEYSDGRHQFRFLIENLGSNKHKRWIFFGIISKSTPVQIESYKAPSSYGWAGQNKVFRNGVQCDEYDDYKTNMKKNDIFALQINCDQRTIYLTNERTHKREQLNIDINRCPLPWQVNICLYYAKDSIRILSGQSPYAPRQIHH